MRKMDKELIDQIKDNLHAHEEAYTPGAWERFAVQEEKKKRGFIYWPLWSAAAIILIAGGLFFFRNDEQNQTKIVVNKPIKTIEKPTITAKENTSKPVIIENKSSNPLTNEKKTVLNSFGSNQVASVSVIEKNNLTDVSTSNLPFAQAESNSSTLALNDLSNQPTLLNTIKSEKIAQNLSGKNIEFIQEKKKPTPSKITFEQILAADSHNNKFAKTEKDKTVDKWEPGVFVAPAMGNDSKVNMNYGFSLSYSLAKKLSISSGIAYTALSGKNELSNVYSGVMNSPSSSQALSTDSKSLESVDARVRGINIPLELKYNISDKLYTGIGVSALAILNNSQENNYIVSQTQNTTVVNSMGYAEQKMLVVTGRVSETQKESVTAPEKYLGFYNFSLGYKQKISPKKNIAVEPFLRIPMKSFSKDNLNLTNGGLRLKLDF